MCNKKKGKQRHNVTNNNKAENEIGDEGASALGEALKVNTSLKTLDLTSEQQQQHVKPNKDTTTPTTTKQIPASVVKERVH